MAPELDRTRPESAALLANLEETRREVVIPAEYDPLRNAVATFFGVRQSLDKLLTEVHHPLRNLTEIDAQLTNLCGGMFHYFERSGDRAELADLLKGLFGEPLRSEPDEDAVAGLVGPTCSFSTR